MYLRYAANLENYGELLIMTENDRWDLIRLLIFKRRIKSHLPSAGIIRNSPYSARFQDKG